MVLVKLKIVEFLLRCNIKVGQKLAFYHAMYSATDEIKTVSKGEKFDLRGMSNRMKNIIIHDQDVIDKRLAECNKCEFLFKPTNTCKKCGCFVDAKTKIATASCPVGKWGKEYEFIKGVAVNGTSPNPEL